MNNWEVLIYLVGKRCPFTNKITQRIIIILSSPSNCIINSGNKDDSLILKNEVKALNDKAVILVSTLYSIYVKKTVTII